jgi:ribosomal protein S18 acetylase RimI-like enzyme
MSIYHRPYDPQGADFVQMWRLLQADYARRGDNFVWLVSRFGDWKYGCWREAKLFPAFFRRHAQVWVDGFDEVQGFVLSEDGENIFFIVTAPGYDHLYDEILDWTATQWGPRYGSLLAEVNEGQPDALAALARRGFMDLGHIATTRAYAVAEQAALPSMLPAGFRVVSIAEEPDYLGKRQLQCNAFSGRNEVRELDLLTYEYSRESSAYDPWLDLSIVAPDGQHVASCVGFVDPRNHISEIERVCTHSDHRQRGYALAVIRACCQRLQVRGVGRAYITSYGAEANNLYEKLHPVNHSRWHRYELKTADVR